MTRVRESGGPSCSPRCLNLKTSDCWPLERRSSQKSRFNYRNTLFFSFFLLGNDSVHCSFFVGGEAEKEYVQIKGITGQSVITCKLSQVDCFARSSASQRAAAAAAHQLLFIMSGPKPTSAVHNFIVDILIFFLTCFWIECEMKTWRFLFKCFFLYKSRFCGFQDLYVHYVQRFVSRDKTLRLQSYFFFFSFCLDEVLKSIRLCVRFLCNIQVYEPYLVV